MAYPFYPQMQPTPQAPYQQGQFQPQIQNSGFIPIPNEETARVYPVAPGYSISFRDENAPYLYTKTMGFSQFDRPVFKKYKLIEEEPETSTANTGTPKNNFDVRTEIDKIWSEINDLKKAREKDDRGGHDE